MKSDGDGVCRWSWSLGMEKERERWSEAALKRDQEIAT